MINWKESLSKFMSVNGCHFALTPKQVESWAEPIVGDLLKAVRKEQEQVKIEKEKNRVLLTEIDRLYTEIAKLRISNEKVTSMVKEVT